jgi:4,5-dihydroxyphthalate decarboxylase
MFVLAIFVGAAVLAGCGPAPVSQAIHDPNEAANREVHAFNKAKDVAMKRMENPRIVPLAWYREAWEEQEALLGTDPWENGLTDRNTKQLEMLSMFAHEQGLTNRRLSLDELFLDVSQGRKRGHVFRV